MTDVTLELRVLADELPTALVGVVEGRSLPFLVPMAMGAVGSKAAGMRILRLMAAETRLRQLHFHVSRPMAFLALEICVRPFQCESSLASVIEAR